MMLYTRPVVDADGSKQVSGRDFRRIILASELPLTAVEIALLSRLFVGSPGFIDYDRFLKFVTTGMCGGLGQPLA